ncbi:hypothetical protein LUZ60_017182 [Juncus effusus]|nr:hypothetical protein LUZ60_017182 [Juncus effusus]
MALSLCFSALSISAPVNGARLSSSSRAPMALQLRNNTDISSSFSGSSLSLQKNQSLFPVQKKSNLTVFAKKKGGYKMKTHKASAKRFKVTGSGKIVRRCAGKQHLLGKKNTKRKKRLSKMVQVHKSNYDNIIGAMPYLKVNRKAN